jgi:hypothetical protein
MIPALGAGGREFDSRITPFFYKNTKEVLPGLEPGLQGSKPWVLTNYTIEPCDDNPKNDTDEI